MAGYKKQDVKDLAYAMRRAQNENEKPFSIITGAGCSKSAGIPTAPEFVKEINETYKRECDRHLTDTTRKNYGHCMSVVPKNERKKLLNKYLDNAKVNWGHLAIASMLANKSLARILTFNFDSIMARSCGMLGLYPATYDFATGFTNSPNQISEPAILHLHGQGHGIALLNTEDETDAHARNLRPLIRDTLNKAPLLIIGYSGLSDSVFPVLLEEYDANESLFWVDYAEKPNENIREIIAKGGHTAHYLGGADADAFLIDLARELGCWPPELFTNPYQHLIDELAPVAESPNSETDEIITNLRQRLNKDSEKLRAADLPTLHSMLMDERFDEVINKVDLGSASEDQKETVFWALNGQGNTLSNLAKQEQSRPLYEDAFSNFEAALAIKPDDHMILNNWGIALKGLAKQEQSRPLYEDAFSKYEAALAIRPDDYQALSNWGVALSDLAEQEQSRPLYEESFSKYEAALAIKPDNYDALTNWGIALSNLAEQEQSRPLYEESFSKYEAAVALDPDEYGALYSWGCALSKCAEQFDEKPLLAKARTILLKAQEINPDKVYNLACLCALEGDLESARSYLKHCLDKGTLPEVEHLKVDSDLDPLRELDDPLRELDWFTALIVEAEKKASSP